MLSAYLKMKWTASITDVRTAIITRRLGKWMAGPELTYEERNRLGAVHEIAQDAVINGRLFDLGHMPSSIMIPEATRAAPLFRDGRLRPPFGKPWVAYHTWEHGNNAWLIIPEAGSQKLRIIEFLPVIDEGRKGLLISPGMGIEPKADSECFAVYSDPAFSGEKDAVAKTVLSRVKYVLAY